MADIRGLAYIVAEASELGKWRNYAEQVLGMMACTAPDGGLHLKMDERDFRIAVQCGARDGYVASGWEVASQAGFVAAVDALRAAGVEITLGSTALCVQRCVQQLAAFDDPSGNRHEIVWGFQAAFQNLRFRIEPIQKTHPLASLLKSNHGKQANDFCLKGFGLVSGGQLADFVVHHGHRSRLQIGDIHGKLGSPVRQHPHGFDSL